MAGIPRSCLLAIRFKENGVVRTCLSVSLNQIRFFITYGIVLSFDGSRFRACVYSIHHRSSVIDGSVEAMFPSFSHLLCSLCGKFDDLDREDILLPLPVQRSGNTLLGVPPTHDVT